MATVGATTPAVPGLHVAPTPDDLKNFHSEPEIPSYGVQKRFAMHLIYCHTIIENVEVMMGTNPEIRTGGRTRPMKIQNLDLSNLHGHVFKLTSGGLLQAYEYREGPPINLTDVAPVLFSDLIGCLQGHQQTDLLRLEIIDPEEPLVEFDLGGNGTVMLKPEQAKYGKVFKETGFFYYEAGME